MAVTKDTIFAQLDELWNQFILCRARRHWSNERAEQSMLTAKSEVTILVDDLDSEIKWLKESSPDDIRKHGWAVAVHNDYRLNGVNHTFWLFTKGDRNLKGEGQTDQEALNQIREQLRQFTNLI